MNHKAFRVVFVFAVAIALFSVVVRMKDTPEARPAKKKELAEPIARPLASYRVSEESRPNGMDYLAANYKANFDQNGFRIGPVPEKGSRMAPREFIVEFGAPRIEQGSVRLECQNGKFSRPSHGVGEIDRGAVVEQYLLENRRAEQIFRFPVAIAMGALRLCIPVKSDLSGQVIVHSPEEKIFKDPRFAHGGLAFCDGAGETRLAYHSAVVADAEGRELSLVPRYEHAEIVLEVPEAFMKDAAYPVVIDPWLSFDTGFAGTFRAAERPAISKIGTGSFGSGWICWSDNSTGNFEIYVSQFDGNSFNAGGFGTSLAPGGISNNKGDSVNPSIAVDTKGQAFVAWEDDTNGTPAIYLRHWNGTSSTWEELSASGSLTGLSGNFFVNRHPSVSVMRGIIPGSVTVDPTTGTVSSTPAIPFDCPVVAWDGGIVDGGVSCSAFYPGAPAIPPNAPDPNTGNPTPTGLPAVPAGWYMLNGNGSSLTQTGGAFAVGEFPSLVVAANNRPAIAFQTTGPTNTEIFMQRWTNNSAGSPLFQIVSNSASTGFNILPPGQFTDVTGAVGAGQVSGAAMGGQDPVSQLPSMVRDGANFTIAWQATESAGPPAPPGTHSQIYVARSVGGGAFAPLGASVFPGGISNTTAQASTPSIDVGNGSVAVAWADNSNSLSSIYVRQLPLAGPLTWNQVGFQGSAFPPAFIGEIAPIAGVSQSTNFAIEPQIAYNGEFLEVIWADGDLSNFNILGKLFSPNAPGVTVGLGTNNPSFDVQVQQSSTDPTVAATPIAPGQFSTGTSVWLFARVFTETEVPPTTSLLLQIEIQPQGSSFTFTPNLQTLFVAPDSPTATPANLAVIKFDGLPNFNYHWIARTFDPLHGLSSPWISPGEVSGVSFRINSSAPAGGGGGGGGGGGNGPANTGSVGGGSSGTHRSQCGLTGLEAVALLGLLRLVRRRNLTKK